MLTKKQTFELYTAIKKLNRAAILATHDLKNKEAKDEHAEAYLEILKLLRQNCKDDFWEWPDEEVKIQ